VLFNTLIKGGIDKLIVTTNWVMGKIIRI